jgi:hypothetical protein
MAASDEVHFEPCKEHVQGGEQEEKGVEIISTDIEKPAGIQYNAEDMQRRIQSLQSSYEAPQGIYLVFLFLQ